VTFGLLAFVPRRSSCRRTPNPDPRRIDIAGGVFARAGLAALIFAVIQAETSGSPRRFVDPRCSA